MDNNIRNILKNAGKDPKEIRFQEAVEGLAQSSKNVSYVGSEMVRLLKEEFENDRNQTNKVYIAYARISQEYPFKIDEEEFPLTDLIRAYNTSHSDGLFVYNKYYVFNDKALIEYLKQYGIRTEVTLSSIYVAIDADKFRELVREASEDNGYKKR